MFVITRIRISNGILEQNHFDISIIIHSVESQSFRNFFNLRFPLNLKVFRSAWPRISEICFSVVDSYRRVVGNIEISCGGFIIIIPFLIVSLLAMLLYFSHIVFLLQLFYYYHFSLPIQLVSFFRFIATNLVL